MPKGKIPSTYRYKPEDSPLTVANQFGIQPNQLIEANPGGYPFSAGQSIVVPPPVLGQPNPGMSNPNSIYNAGQTPAGQTLGVSSIIPRVPNPRGGTPDSYRLAPGFTAAPSNTLGGGGYTPPSAWSQAWVSAQAHRGAENQSMPSIPGVSNTAQFIANYLSTGQLPPNMTVEWVQALKESGMDVSGFAQYYTIGAEGKMTLNEAGKEAAKAAATPGATGTPGAGEFYGYERDPETGRSVRVVKNTATSSFYNELRWDPQRKKYVKIGDLMRQGKLRPDGSWNARGNKKGGRRPRPAAPVAEDAASVANDFVNFNVSSG